MKEFFSRENRAWLPLLSLSIFRKGLIAAILFPFTALGFVIAIVFLIAEFFNEIKKVSEKYLKNLGIDLDIWEHDVTGMFGVKIFGTPEEVNAIFSDIIDEYLQKNKLIKHTRDKKYVYWDRSRSGFRSMGYDQSCIFLIVAEYNEVAYIKLKYPFNCNEESIERILSVQKVDMYDSFIE